jgi:hypothetical protein
MIEFTNKQIEMLYEMSEIHFQWFQKYTPETEISFEEVLKLNHQKMIDIVDACFDLPEDMIDFIFESVIRDYKEMLDGYNFDEDDFEDLD